MDELGASLIFLISQPRSGSTLLQEVLGGHPRIHTLPEPWVMLHLVYGLRPDGLAAEYDAPTAQKALANFLSVAGGGRHLFLESIRAAALPMYENALSQSGKDLFLDKTPRYYLIAEELREVFPSARVIFLLRNPLAVLSSILNTLGGDWTALRRLDRMHDLVTGPRNILRAANRFEDRVAVVRYEDLVRDADATLSQLLARLEIQEVPNLKRYRSAKSEFGDTKSISKHGTPVDEYVDLWKQDLLSPERRDVAVSYVNELGPSLLDSLGYPYAELMNQLGDGRYRATSARWRMLVTPDDELSWWHRLRLGFVHSRYQRGMWKTILRAFYIALLGHAPRDRSQTNRNNRKLV